MKTALKHILGIILLIFMFSSCNKEEDIIPRKKMSMIYAEMFLVDQWIQANPQYRWVADTTLMYEPILQKYGYTSEDYRRSVYKYLDDPERFARIFRETANIYDKRIAELDVLKNLQKTAEEKAAQSEKFKVDFKISEHFPYMFEEPYVHYHDSLGVELDTLTREYKMKPVELSDTTYSGPEMIVRTDTLAVTDSVIESSGLATKDSLTVKGKPKDALKDALKQKTDPKEIRHLPVKNLKKDKENILVPMKMPLEKK